MNEDELKKLSDMAKDVDNTTRLKRISELMDGWIKGQITDRETLIGILTYVFKL